LGCGLVVVVWMRGMRIAIVVWVFGIYCCDIARLGWFSWPYELYGYILVQFMNDFQIIYICHC